jgi:hypothetical protein
MQGHKVVLSNCLMTINPDLAAVVVHVLAGLASQATPNAINISKTPKVV